MSGRMNGERGPVSLENEVRAELGRVLVYGRFLSGRQTPPGPAEGREDREAGVLRQMSRQPRGPFSGPSPPRPLSLTCGSSLTRPAGVLVAALPGPRHLLLPVDFIFLHCTRLRGICLCFVRSQPCCSTAPGARLALGKYWLSK